jgi:carboxyl-terminal processing protease
MTPIADWAAETEAPGPTAVVRAAVDALATQFFEPLAVDELLRDAWTGATAALTRAGRSSTPPPPDYPSDALAAYALHDQTFPTLERLADGLLSLDDIATAALEELLARRRDGHTHLSPRGRFWSVESDTRSPAGWASRTFGMVLTDTPPLGVADVVPRGLAQKAGLRRGQAVLAINGQPASHLRRLQAAARLDWQPGVVNVLSLRAADGESVDLELRSELVPMPSAELLAGPFGLLRMDGFASSGAETAALRAAFMGFEQAGARGWIIDLRWAGGGASIQLSRLLVSVGRLFARKRHDEVHLPDGTVLSMRQDVDLDDTALPFQRPLVVLIGPGSISGAESFAGPMQAYGRAILVGERTAGMCGVVRSVTVAPGWTICLASHHTDLGPDEWQLNRIGVTPDVPVSPTPDDEAAGRDPQLDTALEILRTETSRVPRTGADSDAPPRGHNPAPAIDG